MAARSLRTKKPEEAVKVVGEQRRGPPFLGTLL